MVGCFFNMKFYLIKKYVIKVKAYNSATIKFFLKIEPRRLEFIKRM